MAHHHHHHDHESSLPKLPKLASQVLFVVVVALLTAVSIFVYKKLIPVGEYVSEQEDVRRLKKMCKEDIQQSTQEVLLIEDCTCLANQVVKNMEGDPSLWIKQSNRQGRLVKYELYIGSCKP